jgi:tRNA dimethylallyltransferase
MSTPRVWLIAGPTASGKSALALELARAVGGEIVGADSMQLYAGLETLTAAPGPAERAAAPHHLVGVADPGEAWSVGRWLAAALAVLAQIAQRGVPALVVGGTGLYFRALTRGLADVPPVPAAVRAAAQAAWEAGGETAVRARLERADPAAAARIAPGDRQRLTRALEVFEASGRPLSAWQGDTIPALPASAWRGVVLTLPRAELNARIDVRLARMAQAGVLEEVAALLARRLDPALPAMKTLGLAAFARQLAGELAPADALAEAAAATRRYAKRQTTWFDHQQADWPRLNAHADLGELGKILRESGS